LVKRGFLWLNIFVFQNKIIKNIFSFRLASCTKMPEIKMYKKYIDTIELLTKLLNKLFTLIAKIK